MSRISGKVLSGGAPVAGAEIELTPVDNRKKNFRGLSQDDGAYYIDYGGAKGLPPGTYRVRVTVHVQADGQPLPAGEEGAALRNSGQAATQVRILEITVNQGSQSLDLLLDNAQIEQPPPPPAT